MQAIKFELSKIVPKSSSEICFLISDVALWSEFEGYGILPGIKCAEYEKRTDNMLNSRIRVTNTDGSKHVEEILEWKIGKRIVMKLHEFRAPLKYLSTHFIEEWCFEQLEKNKTMVTRKFQIFPKSLITKPFMWLIALFFKKAIAVHLDQIAEY